MPRLQERDVPPPNQKPRVPSKKVGLSASTRPNENKDPLALQKMTSLNFKSQSTRPPFSNSKKARLRFSKRQIQNACFANVSPAEQLHFMAWQHPQTPPARSILKEEISARDACANVPATHKGPHPHKLTRALLLFAGCASRCMRACRANFAPIGFLGAVLLPRCVTRLGCLATRVTPASRAA